MTSIADLLAKYEKALTEKGAGGYEIVSHVDNVLTDEAYHRALGTDSITALEKSVQAYLKRPATPTPMNDKALFGNFVVHGYKGLDQVPADVSAALQSTAGADGLNALWSAAEGRQLNPATPVLATPVSADPSVLQDQITATTAGASRKDVEAIAAAPASEPATAPADVSVPKTSTANGASSRKTEELKEEMVSSEAQDGSSTSLTTTQKAPPAVEAPPVPEQPKGFFKTLADKVGGAVDAPAHWAANGDNTKWKKAGVAGASLGVAAGGLYVARQGHKEKEAALDANEKVGIGTHVKGLAGYATAAAGTAYAVYTVTHKSDVEIEAQRAEQLAKPKPLVSEL